MCLQTSFLVALSHNNIQEDTQEYISYVQMGENIHINTETRLIYTYYRNIHAGSGSIKEGFMSTELQMLCCYRKVMKKQISIANCVF